MKNKVFITGGAQRIGKALVHHFHSIGWDILFHYRSSKTEAISIQDSLNKIRPNSCQTIQCDFDDEKSSENFYEELAALCIVYYRFTFGFQMRVESHSCVSE